MYKRKETNMIIRLNDPFREYIQPTDVRTNETIPVHIERIVKLVPQPNITGMKYEIPDFENKNIMEG